MHRAKLANSLQRVFYDRDRPESALEKPDTEPICFWRVGIRPSITYRRTTRTKYPANLLIKAELNSLRLISSPPWRDGNSKGLRCRKSPVASRRFLLHGARYFQMLSTGDNGQSRRQYVVCCLVSACASKPQLSHLNFSLFRFSFRTWP